MELIHLWQGRPVLPRLLGLSAVYFLGLHFMGIPFSVCLFFLLFFPGWEDYKTGFISDGWSLLLGLCGLINSYWCGWPEEGLFSGAVIFALFGTVYMVSRRTMGTGDLFLATAAALWLTPVYMVLFLWLSCVSALIFFAVPLLCGKKSLRDSIVFGPFLGIGAFLAYGAMLAGLLSPGRPFP